MEKWTGIISGTNRGLVVLDFDMIESNKIKGTFNLYDVENINLSGKVEGEIQDKVLRAKIFEINPQVEGNPKEGEVSLTFSDDNKELKGQWKTDAETQGECTLYKFSLSEKSDLITDPNLTLETKDITVQFCTFDKKSVENIFSIMTHVTRSIRSGKEKEILPPIYSVTYDKEERIITYSLEDFLKKFYESDKIWYVGFEFKDSRELKNIFINFYFQQNMTTSLRSNVLVASTDKELVLMIPEMIRGLISKTRNRHAWCHHWIFEASIQILAVITMFALAYFLHKRVVEFLKIENTAPYIFIAWLIVLSNLWTYLSRLIFNTFHNLYPVVEIINKRKGKILPVIFIGVITSIIAAAVIYCVDLLLKFVF